MKRLLCIALALVTAACTVAAAQPDDDIRDHQYCKYCGMNRLHYAHSRMLIEYDDGSVFGSCSIHCALINLAVQVDRVPESIMVADYSTRKLIDAENAYWVIGGNKHGVMTKRAKWAFQDQKEAESFIKTYGGRQATFDEAEQASYEDMYEDSKMIRHKRKIRRMQR